MNHKITHPTPPPIRPNDGFSHLLALSRLRALNWQPSAVYDIGAFHGQWSREAAQIFPGAKYLLFEANADNAVPLAQTGYPHFLCALGSEDGAERPFFVAQSAIATGASLYRESTAHYTDENCARRTVVTTRLDSLVALEKLKPANLIKIDVQGAELDVLAGAPVALKSCEVLIIETSLLRYNKAAPLFGDVVAALNGLGFKCIDICEIHRAGPGSIFQLDLMFARDDVYRLCNAALGLP
jgi:FkbM family methyltransferase